MVISFPEYLHKNSLVMFHTVIHMMVGAFCII